MTLVLLFLMQLGWSASYMFQKQAMIDMPVGLILILRYGIASLAFLLAGQFKLTTKFSAREWALIIFMGILVFSGSPYCQLIALTHTYATDTAILTAFEPLIAASIAAIFLKERIGWKTLAAFFVATFGMIIMSGWQGTVGSLQVQRMLGDTFFLAALLFEGVGSTVSRYMVRKRNPFELMAWMMFVGFLVNLACYWPLLTPTNIVAVGIKSWGATLYLALICSALSYSGWTYLLKKIPVNQLALSTFLQPICGTFLAHYFINEPLDEKTLLGGGLILSSLLLWLFSHLKKTFKPLTMPADVKNYS